MPRTARRGKVPSSNSMSLFRASRVPTEAKARCQRAPDLSFPPRPRMPDSRSDDPKAKSHISPPALAPSGAPASVSARIGALVRILEIGDARRRPGIPIGRTVSATRSGRQRQIGRGFRGFCIRDAPRAQNIVRVECALIFRSSPLELALRAPQELTFVAADACSAAIEPQILHDRMRDGMNLRSTVEKALASCRPAVQS